MIDLQRISLLSSLAEKKLAVSILLIIVARTGDNFQEYAVFLESKLQEIGAVHGVETDDRICVMQPIGQN